MRLRSARDKRHWTTIVGHAAGHQAAFVVVILYAVQWLSLSRPTPEWNAVATLAVFVMTLNCLKFPHSDQAFSGN